MKRFLAAVVIGVVVFAVPAAAAKYRPTKAGAYLVCQEFVKDYGGLKAPGSAQFPAYSDSHVTVQAVPNLRGVASTKKRPIYRVTGIVDAENSFGALLRLTFSCTVRFQPTRQHPNFWYMQPTLDLLVVPG
jgi:hypothetical protein